MDNEGVTISSVILSQNEIKVNYENGAVETLPKSCETYHAFYQKWLVNDPPFISDKFKAQMRDIILCSINDKETCKMCLCEFFSSPNEEKVKQFLTYMRSRHMLLPQQKAIWNNAV